MRFFENIFVRNISPSTDRNFYKIIRCMTYQQLRFSRSSLPHHERLTIWRPLLPYAYSYKASCARTG